MAAQPGARPMETVLAGTGGCTAYDVVLILKRSRHDVQGCQVRLQAAARRQTDQGVHEDPTCASWSPAGPAEAAVACHQAVARAYCSAHGDAGQDRRVTTPFGSSPDDRATALVCFDGAAPPA